MLMFRECIRCPANRMLLELSKQNISIRNIIEIKQPPSLTGIHSTAECHAEPKHTPTNSELWRRPAAVPCETSGTVIIYMHFTPTHLTLGSFVSHVCVDSRRNLVPITHTNS